MREETVDLILAASYLVIVGVPVFWYVHKGRQSGKVTPKMAATLLAVVSVGVPFLIVTIARWPGFTTENLLLSTIVLLGMLLIWFSAYIGPFGIGWTGRWDNYIYPTKDNKKSHLFIPDERIPSERTSTYVLTHSWRFLILIIVIPEIAVFAGAGLILHNSLLTIIGIAVPPIHLAVFLVIWHWKKENLKQRGWRW